MRIVAIIPAKGTSRRLPKKNIYPLWGEPMLYWAIKACKESQYDIEPWVSTEDKEVAKIAKSFGAEVHKRNPKLSDSKTYKQAVIRSAAKHITSKSKVDIFISLQPNSPQILAKHLDNAIDTLLKFNRDEIFSVDENLMQNAAFRVFKGDYVFQKDLSTNCGTVVCDLRDVHTIADVRYLSSWMEPVHAYHKLSAQRRIDCLTVLHNKHAVQLYIKHYNLFKACKNKKIKLVFKVACPEKYFIDLPEKVEKFRYERVPFQGSIDHAYNLHTLLNQVKTKWFCVMDPDVYPISNTWDINIDILMNKYDIIGMPYSSDRRLLHKDYPALHLAFYKKNVFFEKAKEYGLYDEQNKNWYIFYPLTKQRSLYQIETHATKCARGMDMLLARNTSRLKRLADSNGRHPHCIQSCPDNCKKHNKKAMAFLSRASELDEEHLLPAGKKVKNLFKKYCNKYNTFAFGSANSNQSKTNGPYDTALDSAGTTPLTSFNICAIDQPHNTVEIRKILGSCDTGWKTSVIFDNTKVFCFNEHNRRHPPPYDKQNTLMANLWGHKGFAYSDDKGEMLFVHYGNLTTGGSNRG